MKTNELLPPPPRARRPWLTVLLGLVIFAGGLACGVGGTLWLLRDRALRFIHHPEEMPAVVTARMRSKLGLTDTQAATVQAILERHQHELVAIRAGVLPQVAAHIDAVEREVAAVLNPEQAASWTARVDELRTLWLPKTPGVSSSPTP